MAMKNKKRNDDDDMGMDPRKIADCRKMPNDVNCSITVAGTEEEVVPLMAYHMATVHGYEDTPEMREEIREGLEDEE